MEKIDINEKKFDYYDLEKIKDKVDLEVLPITIRILLENVLRNSNNEGDWLPFGQWSQYKKINHEIAFYPARVLMQDFTGVPAIVDLAAMRDAMRDLGKDPQKINPTVNVDLVIDHSVQVDSFASENSLETNTNMEMQRNKERYAFLRWGQNAFDNFRVVPPGTGICHQVNLEYLAKVVWQKNGTLFPDTVVGTDSHTTMINGLGVLGWGVGGIEAESAMLGQPISMMVPEVVGVKLTGRLPEGITATDLTLHVTNALRAKGVVSKFVEFFGEGLDNLTLADRATIANMSPEYGATCGFFPVDHETLKYLKLTGRTDEEIEMVKDYCGAQGLLHDAKKFDKIMYTDLIIIDLSQIEYCLAGPKRPQDKVALSDLRQSFTDAFETFSTSASVPDHKYKLHNGDVVIAAITSCTNTSNPFVLIGAALIARKARALGLKTKDWVKTSFAPGSQVVSQYLKEAGLQEDLNYLGFNIVGYGCTTCIGNSGPLPDHIISAINEKDLAVAGVLSGNRNFEGRINPHVKANYLASPMFVVIFALAGTINIDLYNNPICEDSDGREVFFKDLWPTNMEIMTIANQVVQKEIFVRKYAQVFAGDERWRNLANAGESQVYQWSNDSTYIQQPPFFAGIANNVNNNSNVQNIDNARVLAIFGDSITTDHISPAGNIKPESPAGLYLQSKEIEVKDFNSYGARRGNHEVMMRGTFANIRIKNKMMNGEEGGFTLRDGEKMPIYDAAMAYKNAGVPTVILAGKEYGTGSSRDWAAKGTMLLGIKAVVAESFERIHRSNLVGMGVLPLLMSNPLPDDVRGDEIIDIEGLDGEIMPQMQVKMTIKNAAGNVMHEMQLTCAINTAEEIDYLKNGSILHNFLLKV